MSDHHILHDLSNRIQNTTERRFLEQAYQEHLRNGRGFWPVVTIDGVPQVVRFSSVTPMTKDERVQTPLNNFDDRWTPETGGINIIPLYALPITDWPRVNLTVH